MGEIVVVCDPSFRHLFEGDDIEDAFFFIFLLTQVLEVSEAKEKINVPVKFALPGKERQDSVFSGLQVFFIPLFSFV